MEGTWILYLWFQDLRHWDHLAVTVTKHSELS